jgi:3-deoxy-D-manno-octulosonic acid kinase
MTGGRGGVAIISSPAGECVLRHYHRGGLVARLMGDRYLWTGADRSRGFAEFRLLGTIARLGLPGPSVVATRYCRHGLFYTADLITRFIEDAPTLAECLAAGRLDGELAEEVGALVARFHRAGIWHADLNAHNVLVATGQLYLIDFDRGQLRPPARTWQRANLRRLRRSLLKLGAAAQGEAVFEQNIWQPLLYRYGRTLDA